MEDQNASALNSDDKISSNIHHEENDTPKLKSENNSASPYKTENKLVSFTENEVVSEGLTLVTEEPQEEVFIFCKNEIENSSAQNTAEYIQVCDSNNVSEDSIIVEDKDINVDVVVLEETEFIKNQAELDLGKRSVTQDKKESETHLKNLKSVILKDWDVEVINSNENHGSEMNNKVVLVQESAKTNSCQERINVANNETCATEKLTDSIEKANKLHSQNENVKNSNSENVFDSDIIIESVTKISKNKISIPPENANQKLQVQNKNLLNKQNESSAVKNDITYQLERRIEGLKCPKSVSKEELVKILEDSADTAVRPIIGGKDLFFSIELNKRLNESLSGSKAQVTELSDKTNESDSCNNNNNMDDRQKIVEILEADNITDWKSVSNKSDSAPKENGNDMEISNAIKNMKNTNSETKSDSKNLKRTPVRKFKSIDKDMERTLALQQLREEFSSNRKRSRTTRKVNRVPFLASTVLEKAMSAPEVTTALKPRLPKRRPCYAPENTSQMNEGVENLNTKETESKAKAKVGKNMPDSSESELTVKKSLSNPNVKTYPSKRKSTEAEDDMKATLEAVAKALSETSEKTNESEPKKLKTATKENKNRIFIKKKRKINLPLKGEKKMNSELAKLLGDEGAVRMLYDTQHSDSSSMFPKRPKFKTTSGLKKDLVLKTKLVKNAVMKLSGVGTDGIVLRGKRRLNHSLPTDNKVEEEPLFSSTPNVVLYKPKKKQRAEASRILYRHSSSESFDSSEGYRRTSIDEDLTLERPCISNNEESKSLLTNKTPKGRPKKAETNYKKIIKHAETNEKKVIRNKSPRLSTDVSSTTGSKLNLSNVPIRKSSRPRVVSKKYSIWSSTSMDSLSVESLGLKKIKKASTELAKKLACKELTIMQYEHLVQIVLTPTTTTMKNSFNCEVLQELIKVFTFLSKEDSCRVVLLTSRGNTFCQGVDINKIISLKENERKKDIPLLIKAIRDFILCLSSFKKPVIVGVHGAAVGLGVTILPYCDLIISSDTASFFTPYVKLGQAPEGAPIHTFPLINRQLVSELLFKSLKMTANEALKSGLITQVIPEEKFEEDLIIISRNIASQPVQGIHSLKFLLRKNQQWNVSEALEAEGKMLEEHWNSTECLNNMIKFLNSGELQIKQNING